MISGHRRSCTVTTCAICACTVTASFMRPCSCTLSACVSNPTCCLTTPASSCWPPLALDSPPPPNHEWFFSGFEGLSHLKQSSIMSPRACCKHLKRSCSVPENFLSSRSTKLTTRVSHRVATQRRGPSTSWNHHVVRALTYSSLKRYMFTLTPCCR